MPFCLSFVRCPPGPCPPTNVHVSLQCAGNVGHVTWNAAAQADRYVATAVSSAVDRHNHTCTSNGTGCSFRDLHCGETTVVTVATVERGCMSGPSLPFTFQSGQRTFMQKLMYNFIDVQPFSLLSVICPPTNLTGATTCSNNDITVTWDQSPESGVSYIVRSHGDGGISVNYTTTQLSHMLTGLWCGETYTFTVAARDDECTSIFSQPIETETGL